MTNGRRLMFVHAHPDDEASKGAATAARYVDEGARVVLVTCTGGEAGDVLNPNCPPIPPQDMPAVRARELEAAGAIIGFHAVHLLGYPDSGFHEDVANVPDGVFSREPVDVPATDLAAIVRRERPHVVVTYPEDGGYPHPDHIMVHEVTLRALELAVEDEPAAAGWRVPKLYASHAFPAEKVTALHEHYLASGEESPFEGWMERLAARRRWPCDARVRVDAWFGRRDDALRAHVSQVDPGGTWFRVPRALEAELFPWECYTLLRSDVDTRPPEDDLFAGLEVAAGAVGEA